MKKYFLMYLFTCLSLSPLYAQEQSSYQKTDAKMESFLEKGWVHGIGLTVTGIGFLILGHQLMKHYKNYRPTIIGKPIYDGHRALYEDRFNVMVSESYADIKTIPQGHFLEYCKDKTVLGLKLSAASSSLLAGIVAFFFAHDSFKKSFTATDADNKKSTKGHHEKA